MNTTDRIMSLELQLAKAKRERDELAAPMVRLRKASDWLCYCLAHDYNNLKKPSDSAFSALQDTLGETPETSLARLKAEWQAEAFREVSTWLDNESDTFGGPTYHEAEMIGMAISGPTGCSSAPNNARAGREAFREAARIFDLRRQAEAES